MQLGRHLRELWRLRIGVGIVFLLALFVAALGAAGAMVAGRAGVSADGALSEL